AWAVLVDDSLRIAIGCQSAPGHEEAVREACDQAIRSAHGVFVNLLSQRNRTRGDRVQLSYRAGQHGRIAMTTPWGGPLTTDFDLMTAVAGQPDARNEEHRASPQSS